MKEILKISTQEDTFDIERKLKLHIQCWAYLDIWKNQNKIPNTEIYPLIYNPQCTELKNKQTKTKKKQKKKIFLPSRQKEF